MPKRAACDASYVSSGVIQKSYKIHEKTLRSWAKKGTLRCLRYPTPDGTEGKRLYDITHLRELLGDTTGTAEEKRTQRIAYTRVSSSAQKDALSRQIDELRTAYPDHEIVQDIGSGLNYKRKGFTAILDRVLEGLVKEVVVLHKDRLCRFGGELVESIFEKAGTKLVVHSESNSAGHTTEQELAEDLLAITTVFVARHNGMRGAANRRRRANRGNSKETTSGEGSSVQSLPQ